LNAYASQTNTLEFLEIATILIANGANVGGTPNKEQIEYMAKNVDYYANRSALLKSKDFITNAK
jgi:hypothetical protein